MSKARTRARRLALQALYQWQLAGSEIVDIDRQFHEQHGMKKIDEEYFAELLSQVPARVQELDAQLTPHLERPLDEVDLIERGILRIGTYELLARPDIPYRVVINESVELAKLFGAEQGHRFVNGILDKVAATLRSVEIKAHASR